MTARKEEAFTTTDGIRIAFRSWRPEGTARGIVVIVPGFNSHSGYYGWVAEQLNRDALLVFAIDLRGRGRSEGERFTVTSFADYAGDVAQLIALAKAHVPGLPLFLLGHSAGGVVAGLYAIDRQDELRGLIIESFAFELPAPDFALAIIKGVSHVAPHAHVLRLKNEDFSRDPAIVAAMNSDPLIADEAQPAETLAALVRADQQLRQGFSRLVLPLLILHGTEDKAARPNGSQHFYEAAGAADKTLKLYAGRFHDPLNDVGRDEVIADISNWIDLHL
ncbi:lysophospholipase [Sphingosinicellaceae bacterium]|nr:lysophospholipase [Sphingosinicellaceae bacterium]